MSEPGELWAAPPLQLQLADDEIQVWRAWIDQPALLADQVARTLSADERARAEGFRFDRDRRRFVAGRAILRAILARYLGLAPGAIVFRYLSHGKPALASPPGQPTVHFNLAHADGLALYAFCSSVDLGIDVERLRPIAEATQIAERFFSSGERAILRSLPPGCVDEAFLTCWTRKEAYLKAIGFGLSTPLNACEVTLAPGEPARLLSVAGDSQNGSHWLIRSLVPAPGYIGACVVRGHHWQLRTFGWPGSIDP